MNIAASKSHTIPRQDSMNTITGIYQSAQALTHWSKANTALQKTNVSYQPN